MISRWIGPLIKVKGASLFILFAVIYQDSFSQRNRGIDSLKNILKTAAENEDRARALNILSNQFQRRARNDSALKYANEALALATKKGFKKEIAAAYYNFGNIQNTQGNYPLAMEKFRASLTISKEINDTAGIAAAHSEMGEVYSRIGNYPEAMSNFLIALRLAEKIDLKKRIAYCYEKLGIMSSRQRKLSEALKYQLKALEIREKINDRPGIATSHTNVGLIYGMLDHDSAALQHHRFALRIKQELDERREIAVCLMNIGLIYAKERKYAEALDTFQAALRINEAIPDKRSTAFCYNNIGKIYIALNQTNEARQNLNKGLFIAKGIGEKNHLMNIYHNLSVLDSAEGNYLQALTNYRLYTEYKDSLLNEHSNQQIEQLKAQFESEKKDKEKLEDEKKINDLLLKTKQDSLTIVKAENYKVQAENALLSDQKELQQLQIANDSANLSAQKAEADKKQEQKEKALQSLELKKQKQAKNYFIAGLILFAILSFFVYRSYRTRQQLKLQQLRNKIASDLHDDVGSTLSSISIFSQMALEQSKETIPLLETIGDSSRKMLDAMADIVWTIKPENDQFEQIILRMKSFAYELLGAKKIDFEFVADDEVTGMNLSMEIRKNIYLIFKEATNNMVKYSGANRALFAIRKEKNNLTMMIQDNGKGFDTFHIKQGNGLVNMKRRAHEINGEFLIDSGSGTGTTIRLRVAV